MKYGSLIALSSLLLLIPACKDCNNGSCYTTCPETQTVVETAAPEETVEVVEEELVEPVRVSSFRTDKEDLEEGELEKVMTVTN